MLRLLLICPDEKLRKQILEALHGIAGIELMQTLTEIPDAEEAIRLISARKIGLIVLQAETAPAVQFAEYLDCNAPGIPAITVATNEDPELLLCLMRAGVREHLTAPLDRASLAAAIEAERQRIPQQPTQARRQAGFYSFLPARPGAGASTIALSVSWAMAHELPVRTLLLDGDLWAGNIRFLLKLEEGASFSDALARTGDLDAEMWAQIVSHAGKLDVLHAGDLDAVLEPDIEALRSFLPFAGSFYDVVCADLASSLDPFTVEILKRSDKIFLVTTPEVVVLHMAAARVRRLREMKLADRVQLVLNRNRSGIVGEKDVERLVGIPVAFAMSNDYDLVQGAIMNAAAIPSRSDLGQSISSLARSLASSIEPKPPAPAPRKKFLEYFHVPKTKDDFLWRD